mmetsp:Transcript_122162/g.353240  ORF Transcript_122162/g.353240 Transcript_122162/m.353240 type:complete len:207 (+) Transcript_122162:467-1087(+)
MGGVSHVPLPVVSYSVIQLTHTGVVASKPSRVPNFDAKECIAANSPLRLPLAWPKYIAFKKDPAMPSPKLNKKAMHNVARVPGPIMQMMPNKTVVHSSMLHPRFVGRKRELTRMTRPLTPKKVTMSVPVSCTEMPKCSMPKLTIQTRMQPNEAPMQNKVPNNSCVYRVCVRKLLYILHTRNAWQTSILEGLLRFSSGGETSGTARA